jgi:phosphate transport system protein
MSRSFIEHLNELKDKVARMSVLVQAAVEQAVEAVQRCDVSLAKSMISSDQRIDDDEVKIEQAAISLLALHQPTAVDLRLITTIIKVNGELERIADCAVNVAQRVIMIAQMGAGYELPPDLRLMGNSVVTMLRDTVKAFNQCDETTARQVLRSDDIVDALYGQIVQEVLGQLESDRTRAQTDLANIMIAKNLERLADHCTNIAEDVIYVCSGRIIRHLHAVS